jgi:hypothetical protein
MGALPVASRLAYLTEVEDVELRADDYAARNIVRGLKKEPFEGYSWLDVGGVLREFDTANIQEYIPGFVKDLGERLRAHVTGPISIVPIPNSNMAVGAAGPFRIVELAEEFARGYGSDTTVAPCIRWAQVRDPAHKTNEFRSPDLVQPDMRLVETPQNTVVLFDDVMTSGSQMIAGARLLKDARFAPAFSVVGARAVKTQVDPVIQWRVGNVEAYSEPPPSRWPTGVAHGYC